MNTAVMTIISSSIIFYLLTISYNTYYITDAVQCFYENKKRFYLSQTAFAYGINLLKKNRKDLDKKEIDLKFDNNINFRLKFVYQDEYNIEIFVNIFIKSILIKSGKYIILVEKIKEEKEITEPDYYKYTYKYKLLAYQNLL